jgi:copper chaperone
MTIELKVPNMACGACAKTITQAVIDIDPKASVKADPKTKQVIVDTKVSESSVKEVIAAAGYPAA